MSYNICVTYIQYGKHFVSEDYKIIEKDKYKLTTQVKPADKERRRKMYFFILIYFSVRFSLLTFHIFIKQL